MQLGSSAQRLERELGSGLELPPHLAADKDLAGLGSSLETRRDVDPVAVEITVLGGHHVADVNADPQIARAVPARLAALGEGLAHGDCRAHGVVRARELGQRPVAEELDDAAATGGNDLTTDGLQQPHHSHRLALVLGHEPAITDHVGEPYGR